MRQNWVERRFANLSLTTKGVLVVALPVCALLAAMAVFYQYERQTHRAAESVVQSFEVRAQIRDVLILMINAETGTRGYLLTGDPAFLQPYMTAVVDLPEHLAPLRDLVADNPRQKERLAGVERRIARILESLQNLQQQVVAGKPGAPAADLVTGREAMDGLRQELAWMVSEEERLLNERKNLAAVSEAKLRMVIFAGGLWGLLGGLAAAYLFTRGIVRRMHNLKMDAQRVAQGVPLQGEVGGGDEIAVVECTLHDTSQQLAAQSMELQAANAKLEERVGQRTAELREANDLLQAVMASAPLAIWTMDLDGHVTSWNPAAETMFGWTAAEIVGRQLPIVPEDQQEEFRGWFQRFRAGEAFAGLERKRRRKDGALIDVSIWTAPLRGPAGNIDGVMAIDSDITQRRQLEEQFRQSQKLEAVGRLAGGVAHDFNNLLTVIGGYGEMLRQEVKDDPLLSEFAQEIQNAASRGGALTMQLLAFSRRQISQPRVLDLNQIVAQSTKLLRRVIGEDIEIVTKLDPALGRIQADPIHIDQILMNLVVNARDAISGVGRVTIETANVTLGQDYVDRHIGVEPGNFCLLAVSDTGCGMSAETRSHVFEPFFTTKEPGKGTGLGLSIVYGIVKQNGGEINLYSEQGHGTTFKIYLPMVEVPAEFAAQTNGTVAHAGTETVLLCEDEPWIRKLVATMLAKQGYRVLESQSPEGAIEIAAGPEVIHLLLTDVVMPGMNGFDLAAQVRERRPEVRTLYMSGYTDTHIGRDRVIDPNLPFLQKPFTAASLSEKVREALERPAAKA
jgi:PAS domain S-box-containing protein